MDYVKICKTMKIVYIFYLFIMTKYVLRLLDKILVLEREKTFELKKKKNALGCDKINYYKVSGVDLGIGNEKGTNLCDNIF